MFLNVGTLGGSVFQHKVKQFNVWGQVVKKKKDVPCLPDMLGAPLKLNIPFHPELLQTDQNNDIFSKYICNLHEFASSKHSYYVCSNVYFSAY